MDILLSLPIVSYFFSTSLTSWSTSLNLLFFYMTWSTLVLSQSPLRMEIVGTAVLRIAFWLLPSVLFLAFDTLLPSLAESIKYNGAVALPPRDARTLSRLTGLALLNLTLETAVQAAISLGLAAFFHAPVFRTSTTLPLPWQMIKHIALLYTGRELLTYYIHRYLLHGHPAPALTLPQSPSSSSSSTRTTRSSSALAKLNPRNAKPTTTTASPRLTALHSAYAHARRAPPYSLLLRTDHPLPYLLHRFVPLYLPALALALPLPRPLHPLLGAGGNLHLLTFLTFAALATFEETLALSGYTVIPGIVLGGMARRAAVHYTAVPSPSSAVAAGKKGKGGNFGNLGVLDWVHGTSLGGNVMADLRDEAEKHQLKERGGKKVDEVGEVVRGGVEGLRKGGRNGRSRGRKGKGRDVDE